MTLKSKSLLLFIAFCFCANVYGQQKLKVLKSPDQNKVDIATSGGIATIMFHSSVKNLTIQSKEGLDVVKASNKLWYTYIDAKSEIENKECCYTEFLLRSPKTNELLLRADSIQPGQLIYYTVILPDVFPTTINLEYIYTPTTLCGLRLSCGARYGGYIGYKWGKYKKTGVCIDNYKQDADVTKANELGYIRQSITAGARFGIVSKYVPTYVYIGGGYGEYGRQWENPTLISDSRYFHSDYIKGFDGEVGVSVTLVWYLYASVGVEMIVGNGKVSTEVQVGAGVNLPISIFTKKTKKTNE